MRDNARNYVRIDFRSADCDARFAVVCIGPEDVTREYHSSRKSGLEHGTEPWLEYDHFDRYMVVSVDAILHGYKGVELDDADDEQFAPVHMAVSRVRPGAFIDLADDKLVTHIPGLVCGDVLMITKLDAYGIYWRDVQALAKESARVVDLALAVAFEPRRPRPPPSLGAALERERKANEALGEAIAESYSPTSEWQKPGSSFVTPKGTTVVGHPSIDEPPSAGGDRRWNRMITTSDDPWETIGHLDVTADLEIENIARAKAWIAKMTPFIGHWDDALHGDLPPGAPKWLQTDARLACEVLGGVDKLWDAVPSDFVSPALDRLREMEQPAAKPPKPEVEPEEPKPGRELAAALAGFTDEELRVFIAARDAAPYAEDFDEQEAMSILLHGLPGLDNQDRETLLLEIEGEFDDTPVTPAMIAERVRVKVKDNETWLAEYADK